MLQRLTPTRRGLLALVAGVLLPAGPACIPARAEEQWLVLLRSQIRDSHGCAIQHIVYVREVPVGTETGIEGRLRCVDGREYDFSRPRVHQKFDIRLCQPTIC